jgi:L-lactate dehydrogenase
MKVGLIGVGHVGASVAVSLLLSGAARELLLHDHDEARAEGEAMDLAHGVPYYPRAHVRAAPLDEVAGCDVVVFAAGRNGRPGETRLQLLADNFRVATEIGRRLAGCPGVLVVVSNPVDVLTRVLQQASGLPPERVLGTGTMLDTARLRQLLGQVLSVDAHSVHAHVVGEHGDSEVVLWSGARAGGVPLRGWPSWDRLREPQLASQIRQAAYEIIRRKGATNHAIGLATANLLRCMLRGERRVLTVSRVQPGAGPWSGVALSMPTVVSAEGAVEVLEPDMSDEERAALGRSAAVLREARARLQEDVPAPAP